MLMDPLRVIWIQYGNYRWTYCVSSISRICSTARSNSYPSGWQALDSSDSASREFNIIHAYKRYRLSTITLAEELVLQISMINWLRFVHRGEACDQVLSFVSCRRLTFCSSFAPLFLLYRSWGFSTNDRASSPVSYWHLLRSHFLLPSTAAVSPDLPSFYAEDALFSSFLSAFPFRCHCHTSLSIVPHCSFPLDASRMSLSLFLLVTVFDEELPRLCFFQNVLPPIRLEDSAILMSYCLIGSFKFPAIFGSF